MKEILSYWDILLGFLVIYIGILKLRKFEIYRKKRDNDKLRSGKWTVSKNDSFEYTLFYGLILLGIIFIYNRLNGNLPNIIELIKEFASYWIKKLLV